MAINSDNIKNIEIFKENCVGCSACASICPNNSIKIEIDQEGFYQAKINHKLCTNCGLCVLVCPIYNYDEDINSATPYSFAAWSKNKEIRIKSSSGGIFYELASFIVKEKKGIVYGAAFDENFFAKHKRISIENEDNLFQLMGSKYIQSSLVGIYDQLENDLRSRKYILFTGLPCHIKAIKRFIKIKRLDSDFLYTVDLICHGVPSLNIYKIWLDYVTSGEKIKSISFREKSLGWEKYRIVIEYGDTQKYIKYHADDPFFYGYLKNLYLKSECYDCKYSRIPREGDISLGDYWGAPNNLEKKAGISIVLLNNRKGSELFFRMPKIEYSEANLIFISKYNPRVVRGDLKVPKERYILMDKLRKNELNYYYLNRIIKKLKVKDEILRCINILKKISKSAISNIIF